MLVTTNLGLKKPEESDWADIAVPNENMDILDSAMMQKVDKVTGKQLSTEDYTTAEKTKLSAIPADANHYVHPNHTGDVTSTGDGVTAIAPGVVVNADINASAAIDATKIANGTVSNAEFQYLDGVTSAIQTQLNSKLATSSYTAADALAKILTVDGSGSNLDADLLDGKHATDFQSNSKVYGNVTYNESIPANTTITKTIPLGSNGFKNLRIAIHQSPQTSAYGILAHCGTDNTKTLVVGHWSNGSGQGTSAWNVGTIGQVTNSYLGRNVAGAPEMYILELYINGSNIQMTVRNTHTTSAYTFPVSVDWEAW